MIGPGLLLAGGGGATGAHEYNSKHTIFTHSELDLERALLAGDLGKLVYNIVEIERPVGGGDSTNDSFLKSQKSKPRTGHVELDVRPGRNRVYRLG